MRILTGFYVYGALCYFMIFRGSLEFHSMPAYVLTVLGCGAAAISYMLQEVGRPKFWVLFTVAISWLCPGSALLLIVLNHHLGG